jgi:serine protease
MPGKKPTRAARARRKGKQRSEPGYVPRVVVKFRDGVQLPYEDGVEKLLDRLQIGPWKELAERYPAIRMRRLFNSVTPAKLAAMVEEARNRDRTYRPPNFFTYFVIDCPAADPEKLARDLREWRSVENAYVDPPGEDPVVNAGDDPRSPNQGYVDPAPDGIDAEFAWTFPGGDGASQQFIDLEQGWTLNHEDLNAHGAALLFGTLVDTSRPHGTAVLGEVCAVDNTVGCVGIATNLASVNVVSHSGNVNTIPNAIAAAIATLPFGGVLLLEVQINFLPAETVQGNFDAIRLATALGVVVVEAAGNGGSDLDTFVAGGQQVLNRASAAFRDSGAIMVGAASSAVPHTRMNFSNFGSRIDCYAWGENVDTSSSTTTMPFSLNAYTGTFNGTSSASPIITGAALVVQGLAQANLGYRFSPRQVRGLLSDAATGTASSNPAADRIGVMPDLRAVLDGNVLALAPDVYVRDFVGDNGDPHAGAISASPDVILRPAAEANPQAAFGEGSGTENSQTLGFEAEAGQDNFIYVRARNRGGSDAANVTATVFWAPVATLLTPNLWTLVGSTTIANVPSGNILTVSDAITWPQAQIPGPGHYCFVALVGTAGDPAPSPAALFDWNTYQAFIRNNNNVTWRNFNVVDNNPDPAVDPAFVVLPFLAPGTPDQARRMDLEIVAKLPPHARIRLEVPLRLMDVLEERPEFKVDKKRGVAVLPVNPFGRFRLGEIVFPAKSANPMRLLVHIPENYRDRPYEVFARQLFEGQEVGRVTWRLARPEKREKKKRKRRP